MTGRSFKFTKEKLLALPLPAAGRRAAYHDSDTRGLELRVTASGVKTFSWYRRVKNGKPERLTIGRFPEVTVVQARMEADKYNADRVAGESPSEMRRARLQDTMTFAQLFDLYIERHAKVHKKTWAEDQQRYGQYLAKQLGGTRVSAVTREMVGRLHAQITATGHPTVANRVLALVSSVFGCAAEWSIVQANPVAGIRRNKEVSRDRFLHSHELPRFLSACLAEPNELLRDFFLILLFTAARRANVQSMAWEDINMEAQAWRIPDTKSGDPLHVTLTPIAIEVLTRRRTTAGNSRFVFPGTGVTGHLVEPYRAWKRIFDRDELAQLLAKLSVADCAIDPKPEDERDSEEALIQRLQSAREQAAALGIDTSGCRMPPTRIHDLRRTLASWQAMTGASLPLIGKSLGHKSVATTAIYARLQTDPVRDAMTKATEAMLKGIDLAAGMSGSKAR